MYGEHVLADGIYGWLESSRPAGVRSSRTASPASSPSRFSPISTSSSARWFRSPWRCRGPSACRCGSRRRCSGSRTCCIRSWSALNGLGNWLLRIFGVDRQVRTAEHYHTPEELQLIVQESEDLGALRAESGQVLQELFEFGERPPEKSWCRASRSAASRSVRRRSAYARCSAACRTRAIRSTRGSRPHRRRHPHQGPAQASAA